MPQDIIEALLLPTTQSKLQNSILKYQRNLLQTATQTELTNGVWLNISDSKLPQAEQQRINLVLEALGYAWHLRKEDAHTLTYKITANELKCYAPVVMMAIGDNDKEVFSIYWGGEAIAINPALFLGAEPILDLTVQQSDMGSRFYVAVTVPLTEELHVQHKEYVQDDLTLEIPIILNADRRAVASVAIKKTTFIKHLQGKGDLPKGLIAEKKDGGNFAKKLDVFYEKHGTGIFNILEAGSQLKYNKIGFDQWVILDGSPDKYLLKAHQTGSAFDEFQFKEGCSNYQLQIVGHEPRVYKSKEGGQVKEIPYVHIFANVTFDSEDGASGDDYLWDLDINKALAGVHKTQFNLPERAINQTVDVTATAFSIEESADPISPMSHDDDGVDDIPF